MNNAQISNQEGCLTDCNCIICTTQNLINPKSTNANFWNHNRSFMNKVVMSLLMIVTFALTSCNKDEIGSEVTNASEDQIAYSQRTCNSTDHQHSLMNNSEYRADYNKRLEKMSRLSQTRNALDCDDPIVLPIAVHFQSISNPDATCLKALAQTQIDILNADYQALNSDASLFNAVANNYPGVTPANSCIKFCLADQGHPSASGIADGEPAVTINAFTGDESSTWSGYINIFVRANTGVLGYSPLGGSGNGDGVVIDASAFGSGSGCTGVSPEAPYNLGRTLTHELGHYLLLDHNWGNGGCNSDDQVSDTPNQSDPNYGCPASSTASCGSVDLYMSYMDYTNDACMYMFSPGQASRMNNYVTANFQTMINNIGNVCSGNSNDGDDDDDEQWLIQTKLILMVTESAMHVMKMMTATMMTMMTMTMVEMMTKRKILMAME